MHIYAHGSIFIEFHVQMCKYVQMCMCNVLCTHAHRMIPTDTPIRTKREKCWRKCGRNAGELRGKCGRNCGRKCGRNAREKVGENAGEIAQEMS